MVFLSDLIRKLRETLLMYMRGLKTFLDTLDDVWLLVSRMEKNGDPPRSIQEGIYVLKTLCTSYNVWESCTDGQKCVDGGGSCVAAGECAKRKTRVAYQVATTVCAWYKPLEIELDISPLSLSKIYQCETVPHVPVIPLSVSQVRTCETIPIVRISL
jgi:hypothetical protein